MAREPRRTYIVILRSQKQGKFHSSMALEGFYSNAAARECCDTFNKVLFRVGLHPQSISAIGEDALSIWLRKPHDHPDPSISNLLSSVTVNDMVYECHVEDCQLSETFHCLPLD